MVLNASLFSESSEVKILGYNVYKFEGNGRYVVIYPLPNGSVKVLARGEAGAFPVFIKVPKVDWRNTLSKVVPSNSTNANRSLSGYNTSSGLFSSPNPLVAYVTDGG